MTAPEAPAAGPAAEPTLLPPDGPNAIGRMLGLLGDEWTLLIMREALQGVGRFGRFMEAMPISTAVLTGRLGLLVREGLLAKHVYSERPPRAEYRPTDRGRALWPFMLAIWDWERRWVDGRDAHGRSLPTMRHDACGQEFAPLLTCRACAAVVEAKDVAAHWGPSGSWERSVPEASTRRRSDSDARAAGSGMFPETMMVFGNRWSSALLGAAFRGITRFSDFEAAVGAPPTVVAERLRAFCAHGILVATENEQRTDWVEYHLTEKGRAFYPVIAASLQWAQEWFVAPEGPALEQHHRACDASFVATFRCDRCDQVLAGHEVSVVEPHDQHPQGREHQSSGTPGEGSR